MDKIDLKKKRLEKSSQAMLLVQDPKSEQAIEELQETQDRLTTLEESISKGLEKLDNSKTNELLEKSLDKAVEIQKQGNEALDTLVTKIIEQVAKIRPIVNVPEQKREIINKIVVQDWKKEYMFSDADKSDGTTYVGFVNPSGGWYIERVTKSKTSDKARFIFGTGDYVSNWGKRLQHNYKYLYEAIDAR